MLFCNLSSKLQDSCFLGHSFEVVDYVILMFLNFFQFRLAYVNPESRVFGAGDLVDHPKEIAIHYLHGYFFLDLFVALPLPQVSVLLTEHVAVFCCICYQLLPRTTRQVMSGVQ